MEKHWYWRWLEEDDDDDLDLVQFNFFRVLDWVQSDKAEYGGVFWNDRKEDENINNNSDNDKDDGCKHNYLCTRRLNEHNRTENAADVL